MPASGKMTGKGPPSGLPSGCEPVFARCFVRPSRNPIYTHRPGRLELYSDRSMRRDPAQSGSRRAREASKATDANTYQQIIRPSREMGLGLKMRRSRGQSRPGPNAFIDQRECVRPGTAPPAGAEPLPRAPGPATRWALPSPRTGSAAEGLEFRIEARWSPGGPPVLITVLLPVRLTRRALSHSGCHRRMSAVRESPHVTGRYMTLIDMP